MLNADEITQLLAESWAEALKERGATLEHIKVIDAHVSDIPYTSGRIVGWHRLAAKYSFENSGASGVRV